MIEQNELIETNILDYLSQHENKEILRFLTCGSVDDGKSTLIGRLLHDTHMIYEDQLASIEKDSARVGTTGDQVDLALLVDGLQAEREQGITIDVAYRFFSTDKRKFIIADTPGHEQYTRNMVTGASNSDLAIILMDARKGVLPQTKRHSFISHLLGIKHIVVAVNKMDLVDYDEGVFQQLQADYRSFSGMLGIQEPVFIPMSALDGDNVASPSNNMPWYKGPSLLSFLEDVAIETGRNFDELRFPVQYVNRPNLNFRGFSGTVASGTVSPGDAIKVLPSGLTSQVKSIVTMDGDLGKAFAPMAVTLTLEDEIDISRGDMIVPADGSVILSDQLEVNLVWMDEELLTPGSEYLVKIAGKTTVGRVETLDYKTNVNTLRSEPTDSLKLNEIGRCRLRLDTPIPVDAYTEHRFTGALILIDRLSNATVSAGMVVGSAASLDDQVDLSRQVTLKERNLRMGQLPATVVISAETQNEAEDIAFALQRKLFQQGRSVAVIDSAFLAEGAEPLDVFVVADVLERVGKICIIPLAETDAVYTGNQLNLLSVDVRENTRSDATLRINPALTLHEQVSAIESSLQDHIRL